MTPFDKLAHTIANAGSPFELTHSWPDVKAGFADLAQWKTQTDARIAALEAKAGAAPRSGDS